MEVFLSYSWQDRRFADALRDHLSSAGLRVWNPDRDLLPGDNWLIKTGRALARADSVVFLISKESLRSPWTTKEVEYAIGNRRFEDKVIPIKLSRSVKVPWILRRMNAIDATELSPREVAEEVAQKLASRPARRSKSSRPKGVQSRRSNGRTAGSPSKR